MLGAMRGPSLSTLMALLGGLACGDPPMLENDARVATASRSRRLEPPIPVGDDGYVGRSIATVVATETVDLSTAFESTYADCLMQHAVDDAGNVIAVEQHCIGQWRGLWLFEPATRASRFTFLDDDDDDAIDAFLDAAIGGRLTEDDNHDGAIDVLTESFRVLGPDYAIEGFGDDWIPPAHPKERRRHDTDYDGFFELEVIVGGPDPNGEPTYWEPRSE